MIVYGIKTCDTCRKALKVLKNAGHEVRFVDVRENPLDPQKLDEFFMTFGDTLMNTRSTTWRGLSADARQTSPRELLAEHPTLMKRPVIEADTLHLGWSKDVQDALL